MTVRMVFCQKLRGCLKKSPHRHSRESRASPAGRNPLIAEYALNKGIPGQAGNDECTFEDTLLIQEVIQPYLLVNNVKKLGG